MLGSIKSAPNERKSETENEEKKGKTTEVVHCLLIWNDWVIF